MPADYNEVLERLGKQLEIITGANTKIDESSELVQGLGLDSFKVLDLLLEVEDEFDISIPMNVLADVRTVKDLAQRIHALGPEAR